MTTTITFKIYAPFTLEKKITIESEKNLYDLAVQLNTSSAYHVMKLGEIGGPVLGHDLNLNSTIASHFSQQEEQEDDVLLCRKFTGFINPVHKLGLWIKWYEGPSRERWPPACNWHDVEPINLAPIGVWNGWGSGPTVVVPTNKEENNELSHLIILEIGKVRRVYNKFVLLRALYCNGSKDPTTQTPINLHRFLEILIETTNTVLPICAIV